MVSSTNSDVQKILEQYRHAVENIAKFFEDLGVEAHAEVVTGGQLRSFFLEARHDLHDLEPRFFMSKILDEHVTSIIAEYIASGHARSPIPIIVDKDYNIIAGYTILELVRDNRKDLNDAIFVVYKTNLDVNKDVDFVKAVLIWLMTDYLSLAKHVAPYIHSLEGREIKLGLEHLATLLVLYVRAHIGEAVLNELPPNARVLVGDMFEKILNDEAVMSRLGDLVEVLRVLKHGRYIPALSFLTNLEPLLSFIEKRGKEVKVKVAEVVAPAKVEEALAEVRKGIAKPVEEAKSREKPSEEEAVPETPVEHVEELAEKVEELEGEVEAKVEEEIEEKAEVAKPVLPKAEVYFTVGSDGIPRLCVKCPNCGYVHSERARYSYDLDVEFKCPKCGHREVIARNILSNKVRMFITSNVKARLEVVDVTVEGIRGRCPLCGYEIVTDETTYINCGRCGLRLEIPAEAFEKLQRIRDENPLEGTVLSLDAVGIVVKCPYCGHENKYTRLEQVLEGCRVTCKNCSYTFKIPEDAYSEWARARKSIETMINELYEFAVGKGDVEKMSDLTLRLTADTAKLEVTTKLLVDVLGSFDKLKSMIHGLAEKVEELYSQAIELRREGLEEEAAKKLAEARRLQKIIEAVASKYGTVEFDQDYDRVVIILDPEKYIEDRLRTEIADAYARFGKEIRELLDNINELLEEYEKTEDVDPRTLLYTKKVIIDSIVAMFSRVHSMLYSSRDVYGLRAELERERGTIPEKLYSLAKTILKVREAGLDTIATAIGKVVDFVPIVVPMPNMLATETKQMAEHWKSRGINISQTVINIVAYMLGLALVRRLTPSDVMKLLTMLDPAYGLDGALGYVMYKLLQGHPDIDEIITRYLKVQYEKIELIKDLVE